MGVAGAASASGAGSAAGVAVVFAFALAFFCAAASASVSNSSSRPFLMEMPDPTLLFAFFVSFFLGAALFACDGVGGAAVLVWGDDVAFLELPLLPAAAGADGGGIDCCGLP